MSKIQIIFATKNNGKLKEIKSIMESGSVNVISMADAGIDIDVIEDGTTFEENAVKKAVEICKITNSIVMSDDSGLEIDFLDKQPGVYSARYMGENTPYSVKNSHILNLLKDVPGEKRTARFVCAIAAAIPSDNGEPTVYTALSAVEGIVGYEIKGSNGFGYDPIFYMPEHNMTMAEMPPELKNQLSHRGKALKKMKDILSEHI